MAAKGVGIMIRHILFWNYTDNVKAQHKEEETLKFLQKIGRASCRERVLRLV